MFYPSCAAAGAFAAIPAGRSAASIVTCWSRRCCVRRRRENAKAWEFVLVDDPALLAKLSEAKAHGGAFLKDASLAFVLAGDSSKSDVWIEDVSIAGIVVQLAAHSLGLGSCWVQIRNRPHDDRTTAETFVQQLLGLPEHVKVAAIISVGHPGEEKPAIPTEALDFGKVRHNYYVRPADEIPDGSK